MADGMTVSWDGDSYEVVRKDGRDAAPEPGPVWQVLREGALITSFPADPAEDMGAVREKVVSWLEANADRPTTDIGRN